MLSSLFGNQQPDHDTTNSSEERTRLTADAEEENDAQTASPSNNTSQAEATVPLYGTTATDSQSPQSIDDETTNSPEPATPASPGTVRDTAVEDIVTSLTRRVRCLFSIITWPIVPLGTIASLALVWLLYASFILDVGKSCSRPMHWYAVLSLVLVIYAPYHGRIRSFLFQYTRERGVERPPNVRRYDQLFHTLALIYVYAGITLVQSCREEVVSPEENGAANVELDLNAPTDPMNTCQATCPNLFVALRVYVTAIEVFTFSLILPLLFLPCLYLYFIRRTMQDAESLAALQDRFREEEAMMRNGGVTTQELLDQFEKVGLASDPQDPEKVIMLSKDGDDKEQSTKCSQKECCICMEAFDLEQDEEMGNELTSLDHDMDVIRTPSCGHLFHRRCMSSWIGGRWEAGADGAENESDPLGASGSRRARRTTCPLCRQDVRANR